ncbi:hypothetical protein [Streptomyces sp900116325]|uniref:hypothetical protein n=1 Tax=Streptomyces sp. 900116325 TaxID=3154295 RepID=UPI0033BE6D41
MGVAQPVVTAPSRAAVFLAAALGPQEPAGPTCSVAFHGARRECTESYFHETLTYTDEAVFVLEA